MTGQPIVSVGAALVDVRAVPATAWSPGRSLPGRVRLNAGGAARNVAADLAVLGYPVVVLTAVGTDPLGDFVLDATAREGVDVSHCLRRGAQTGVYVRVGPEHGEPWCVADASAVEALTPADIEGWTPLVRAARAVICDANLLPPVLATVAAGVTAPRVLLATSPHKAPRLRPVLAGATVVVCNRDEALALTGLPPTLSWQALGAALLTEGVERVVLTLGVSGVAVLTAEDAVLEPARPAVVTDPAGAGDAVAAVAVHAHLAGMDPARTAALAVAAAALVVESPEVTPRGLAAVVAP